MLGTVAERSRGTTSQLFPYLYPAKPIPVLSLFRTNQLLATIFVLIFAALLLAAPLFQGVNYQAIDYGILHHYCNNLIQGSMRNALIAALVFLFLGAFVANFIDQSFRLSRDINMMPGLFYVLVSCTAPQAGVFSPLQGANVFMLLALHELMNTFKKNAVATQVFNTGFFMAIASFFYPSYLLFVLLLFVGLNLMRGFEFRERLMVLAGLLAPYVLLGVTTFWLDHFGLFWQLQVTQAFAWLDFVSTPFTVSVILAILVLLLLILVLIFQQGELTSKRVIQSQKRINLLYWALLFPALCIPIQAHLNFLHLMMLAPAAGILAGVSFSSWSRNWAEFLFLVWFALLMVLQYQAFIFPK
jgi:hypothetical protein